MPTMQQDYTVVVLGAGAVGKTSMVTQFIHGFFPDDYSPTIEDCYRHLIQLPDGMFRGIEILDSAGSLPFPAMRDLSIKRGQAFVLVFGINNEKSFLEALALGEQIIDAKGDDTPIVLVGNKQDLEEEREIPAIEAQAAALDRLSCTYVEVSAKLQNVSDVFYESIMKALNVDNISGVLDESTKKSTKMSKILKRNNSADGGSRENVKKPCTAQKCTIL